MSREQERMLTKHGIEWLEQGRLFAKFEYVKTYRNYPALTVSGFDWLDVTEWSEEQLGLVLKGKGGGDE